jgi:hypothetical protein
MGRRYDLSKTKNTVTEIFKNNTEKFYNCKTKEELIDICHQLLDNADVDTEWTHEFFVRLGLIKTFEQARSYVYNAMLRGMGHGVIGYRRQYEECDNAELNEETYKTVKHLPGAIQKVLDMRGSISFDCVAEDDELNTLYSRAKQLGVEFSCSDYQYDNGYVAGRIGQILKFIYMSAHKQVFDRSFSSGIEYESALDLEINETDLRRTNPVEFTEFVNWMAVSYPDFAEGIKENDQLSKLYRG